MANPPETIVDGKGLFIRPANLNEPDPPPEKRTAAPVGAGSGGEKLKKAANLREDLSPSRSERQARRVQAVVRVSDPLAHIMARLAYGEGVA